MNKTFLCTFQISVAWMKYTFYTGSKAKTLTWIDFLPWITLTYKTEPVCFGAFLQLKAFLLSIGLNKDFYYLFIFLFFWGIEQFGQDWRKCHIKLFKKVWVVPTPPHMHRHKKWDSCPHRNRNRERAGRGITDLWGRHEKKRGENCVEKAGTDCWAAISKRAQSANKDKSFCIISLYCLVFSVTVCKKMFGHWTILGFCKM